MLQETLAGAIAMAFVVLALVGCALQICAEAAQF
jgi:hypothetical protein